MPDNTASDPDSQAAEWLLRLHASPQDPQLQHAWCDWLQHSPEHARAWQQTLRAWRLSAGLPAAASPRPTPRRWRSGLALAACLLLGSLLPLSGPADIEATHSLRLEDGSQLTLAAATHFQSDFSEHQRRLQLAHGEAYFDIARDPQRPFIISTGAARVRVTGTAFEIVSSPSLLQVSVAHGAVEVHHPALPKTQVLTAGERLRLDLESAELQRGQVHTHSIAAWREGLLVVEDERLDRLLERFDRSQPGITLLLDPTLGEQRITGVLRLDAPAATLRALLEPHDAQVSQWGPWLRLVRRQSDEKEI